MIPSELEKEIVSAKSKVIEICITQLVDLDYVCEGGLSTRVHVHVQVCARVHKDVAHYSTCCPVTTKLTE